MRRADRPTAGAIRAALAGLLLATAVGACSDTTRLTLDSDAPSSSASATTTTKAADDTEVLEQRDTPLGELVVTRGPATQPWRFDPNGPTDRWREPADCYPPRIMVDVGGRTIAIGEWPTAAGEVVVGAAFARAHTDDPLAAMAVLVFGAVDGTSYSLHHPDQVDRTVAHGGLAVLVDPAERDTGGGNGTGPLDFTVHGATPLSDDEVFPFDLASAENAFYAGDVNTCPGHTGVTPRPTVAPPTDVADASAAAARAFDPATPAADALGLFAPDRHAADQLDAFTTRVAQQAAAFGLPGYGVRPAVGKDPVFHSPEDGWVHLALVAGDHPAPFGFWAKVDRVDGGWQVDPRTICGAFDQLAFGTSPDSCDG